MSATEMVKTKTPGIYKKGARYVVVYRDPKGKQRKKSQRTYDDARRFKAAVNADINRGEFRELSQRPFGDYAREWIDSYQGRTTRGFREITRAGYRRTLDKHAIPYFDDQERLTLGQVEPQHVRGFIAHLFAQKPRPGVSTVRNHVAAVRALFATAAEDGLIRHNPALGVRIATTEAIEEDDEPKVKAMTREQLAAFMAAAPADWVMFFELLTQTGVRISEALALEWRDIEFGEPTTVRVARRVYDGDVDRPKSRKGLRVIPISDGLARRLWAAQLGSHQPVFRNEFGERLADHWVRHNVLEVTRTKAGMEWVGFHTFRHTCASLLFEHGKSIKQVQETLGHHDPAFTLKTYVHLLDEGLGDVPFFDALEMPEAHCAPLEASEGAPTQVRNGDPETALRTHRNAR